MTWLLPEAVFDRGTLKSGLALEVTHDQVTALRPAAEAPDAKPLPGIVAPGFIDLQVNGGGGVLLNTDPTPEGLDRIANAHRRFGTTHLLPTVITDAPEVLDRAADAVLASVNPAVLGLHIEGPHIAPAKRGTHAADFIRPLDQRTFGVVRRLRGAGRAVMITLAPEAIYPGQIAELVATSAVVSLGHTDATADQVRAALDEGATCFTHLFNAMSQMTAREPGAVGAALASDAFCGIIADGIHVDETMVGITLRARPKPDRTFLVSDAMPTLGGPDHFELYGQTIHLKDGRLENAERALAGAHTSIADGVQRIHRLGFNAETSLRMAISTPANLIGRPELCAIIGQRIDDLVRLDTDLALIDLGI